MRPGERELTPELARIRQLAREVAAADNGRPASWPAPWPTPYWSWPTGWTACGS